MSNHSISLGKLFDIKIRIDQSWFILFVFLAWILAGNYFPVEVPNQSVFIYWVMAVFTSVLFFITVLLHELGHSLTARYFKLRPTQITLYVFGGLADIGGKMSNAVIEFWVAFAGPLTSFLIAVFLYFIDNLFLNIPPVRYTLHYLAYINLLLAFFNMLPAFPLDGGRVFRAILWKTTHEFKKATRISMRVSRAIAFLFIFVGLFFLLNGETFQGLWIAFTGWFLESATVAQSHVTQSPNY